MFRLTIDTSDLERVLSKFARIDVNIRREIANAINIGLEEGKPFAEGLISQTYNVGTPSLGIERANGSNLSGSLTASGGMKPVTEFSPQASGGPVGQTVSVEIIRGQRRAIVPSSRGLGRGAFMIGDGRVMERRQDSRFPIFPVFTIGIPQMLGSKKVSEPVRDKITERTIDEISKRWLDSL